MSSAALGSGGSYGARLNVLDSTFTDNTATTSGGAMYNANILTVTNDNFIRTITRSLLPTLVVILLARLIRSARTISSGMGLALPIYLILTLVI